MFVLSMMPYPSGSLHMGHFRVYSISHVLSVYHKRRGVPVLHPISWDSFGLPAEQAATKHGVSPEEWTSTNIDKMRKQLRDCGIQFDWSKEFKTHDPQYYKYTQELFLILYRKGLVERRDGIVNYCPVDKTVLSNEQVIDGKAERSGATVERRLQTQYYFKTSTYASRLLKGLDTLNWPDNIKKQQKNWIGETEVGVLDVKIGDLKVKANVAGNIGYASISPFHTLIKTFKLESQVQHFLKSTSAGNKFTYGTSTGLTAVIGSESVPVYIMDTDSKRVVISADKDFCDRNNLKVTRMAVEVAFEKSYKLKDWLVSRQRKWGTPIPLINCSKCSVVEAEVPVLHGSSITVECPKCGEMAEREQDTLDTFVDSSWYYLYFQDKSMAGSSVDQYIGGREHACLHLLYARYICKILYDEGRLPFEEPFKELITQGMVTNKQGKMSKSRGNGVDPTVLVAKFGSDVVRMYILSKCHPRDDMEWDESGILGMKRFLAKVVTFVKAKVVASSGDNDEKAILAMDRCVKDVERDMKKYSFHTVLSHLIKITTILVQANLSAEVKRTLSMKLLNMLAPFATITCEELEGQL